MTLFFLFSVIALLSKECRYTDIDSDCRDLLKDCRFDNINNDDLQIQASITLDACNADCGVQYRQVIECLKKKEDELAGICTATWNSNCNRVGTQLCHISRLDYWIAKGFKTYSDLYKQPKNASLPCTDCTNQQILFDQKLSKVSGEANSTDELVSATINACGTGFFNATLNYEELSGISKDMVKSQPDTPIGLIIGLSVGLGCLLILCIIAGIIISKKSKKKKRKQSRYNMSDPLFTTYNTSDTIFAEPVINPTTSRTASSFDTSIEDFKPNDSSYYVSKPIK